MIKKWVKANRWVISPRQVSISNVRRCSDLRRFNFGELIRITSCSMARIFIIQTPIILFVEKSDFFASTGISPEFFFENSARLYSEHRKCHDGEG